MEQKKKQGNPSDHLANERTFLAWIRTSIGIMAFGFVVVKFSLFVKQISLIIGRENAIPNRGYSAVVGIILVAVGTVTSVLSYVKYRQTTKHLDEGFYTHSSMLVTVLTAFIFIVSILLIAYLIEST
ncbi:MAG: DUF202 domain-containing protein [Chitinophagaceae bacterium]